MRFFLVFVLSIVLFCWETAAGHHGGGQQSDDSWGKPDQLEQGPRGRSSAGNSGGGWNDRPERPNNGRDLAGSRQSEGNQGQDSRKYRTNLYNDEEVYGYDANYPNGQALYVNYRNSEARARRGPQFARSNSISSRRSGGENRNQQQQDYQREQGGQQQGQAHDNQW